MNEEAQIAAQVSACVAAQDYNEAASLLEVALSRLAREDHPSHGLKLEWLLRLKDVYPFCSPPASDELTAELLTELIYTQSKVGLQDFSTLEYYDELAECYLRTHDIPSAMQTIEAALGIADDLPHDTLPAQQYLATKLGLLYFQQKQWDKAETAFVRVVEIANERSHPPSISVLHRLATCAQFTKPAKAEAWLRKALTIQTTQTPPPSPLVAECLAQIAYHYEKQGRLVAAEQYIGSALEMLEQCGNTSRVNALIPKYRIELANWKARRNDLGLALEQLELTAQHYEALSEQQSGAISRLYQQRMAEVRLLRADFLFAAGETRRALESYQALYNYFYELGGGKTVNLATCLHRLGHTMNHLGESLEAERYLHDAELMLQQIAGANHYRLASLRERVSAMPGG